MKILNFYADYVDGVSPEIMSALQEESGRKDFAYGEDLSSADAVKKMQKAFGTTAEIFFVPGGTQANKIALASMLGRVNSIIAADKTHILNHEAGAIESLGNKIHSVKSMNGKLKAKDIQRIVEENQGPHMVVPKVVAISQPTERGVIYSSVELQEIGEACRENDLYLFIDGSRLGNALMSKDATMTSKDLAKYCDILCIGGTKNGAMYGEALMVFNEAIAKTFKWHIKQNGALLAKSRFIGAQFGEFFSASSLYMENAKHANEMAQGLMIGLREFGLVETEMVQTNQLFVKMPKMVFENLSNSYELKKWQDISPDDVEVRLVTSWNTNEEDVSDLIKSLSKTLQDKKSIDS